MTRTRSPNYPAIGLADAVNRIDQVYKKEFSHPADREVIAAALGYKGMNGASYGVTSALNKYGLLEAAGDQFRVSDIALDIILHPKGHPDRVQAIRRAAISPSLFNELRTHFVGKPPSDENLRFYLIKKGFNPRTVGDVLRSYRDTIEFVNDEGKASYEEASVETEPEDDMQTRKVPTSDGQPAPTHTRGGTEPGKEESVLWFKIAEDCEARMTFRGHVTREALRKLIAHLELSMDSYPLKAASVQPTQETVDGG